MRRQTTSDLDRLLSQPIAHRGLHGCGRRGPVENSLGAARAAMAAGYAIECDVRLSRDGEAIVFHDSALERLTGAPGRLEDFDAMSLGRLHLRGTADHVPTLSELLDTIGGRVPLVIEIKSDGDHRLVERALSLLDPYSGAAALESFDPQVVQLCRRRGTNRPVGLVGPPDDGGEPDPDALAACDFLSWSIEHLSQISRQVPSRPRTTWTVRTLTQQAFAAVHDAQIVFEDLTP